MPFSNDMLYDTWMGIMGLTAARYDSTADILSKDFDKDVSTLMTMYGNIMIRDDKEQLGPNQKAEDEAWDQDIRNRAERNGRRSFDWSTFQPVKIAAEPMPEVENAGGQ